MNTETKEETQAVADAVKPPVASEMQDTTEPTNTGGNSPATVASPPPSDSATVTPANPVIDTTILPAKPPILVAEVTSHMARYVDEANLLVTYAAKKGLSLEEQVISTIVNAKHWLKQKEWTAEREILFWQAFNTIGTAVRPVSVSSLRACGVFNEEERSEELRNKLKKFSLISSGTADDSQAKRTVKAYQTGSLVILFVLLFVQIYWLMASMRVSPVIKLSTQIETVIAELDSIKQRVPNEQWSNNREINNLNAQLDDLRNRLMANYEILKNSSSWSVFIFNNEMDNGNSTTTSTSTTSSNNTDLLDNSSLFQQTTTQNTLLLNTTAINNLQQTANTSTISAYTPETAMRMDILLQERQFILRALQMYLLPVLYGLLGASAYVLRVLTIEIRELIYVKESNISYRLRIQLGALSGLAIGWFIEPDFASFSALSPLALAFLAGYSVELLFALMDKIIIAFSTNQSSNTANK
ncbi:hypothetical protein BegalDRAFT_0815 [Beggiatoa alba B18LD]|uniref:Uncharacterized protein n=1 Tax=Beggiatoa alba B18LD TaxID=395493 RepID=I3CDN3_9GAMM|nr:hypothetical protein [Beggiatoa alba]EIJ41726.1 hypothetical protein BegalDRAFT_0815 [Beggiatoa alba B18LD]